MAGKINTNSEYQIPYTIYEIPEKPQAYRLNACAGLAMRVRSSQMLVSNATPERQVG